MTVWIATEPEAAVPGPAPTIARRATATATFPTDTSLLSDQFDPPASASHEGGHCHWWPRKGTTEWVQYEFAEPTRVGGVEVYFFDDTGRGECRVPATWRILARVDGQWRPIDTRDPPGVAVDRYNTVEFDGITCDGLRLEFQSQPGFAGGVHEWRVIGAE
jgi:hypothetical protein